jgi:hypothetical protein
MRRGYRIIHLYDRPLHPRSSFGPQLNVTSNNGAARLVGCLTIVLATSGFFWLYDTTAHRERSALPMRSQSSSNRTTPQVTTPHTALVPDMNSPQIAFANADVELGEQQTSDKLDEATAKISEVAKAEAKISKQKKSRTVKRPPPQDQAMQNSAPGLRLFQSPFGHH